MRYWKRILLLILCTPIPGSAQSPNDWINALNEFGFQNLRLEQLEDSVWRIDLENGRYRFTPFALERWLTRDGVPGGTVHYIFREKDIPVLHLTTVDGEITGSDWDDHWLDRKTGGGIRGTRNFGQVNIPVGMGFRFNIGFPPNHEQVGLDVLTGLQVTLRKGLSVYGTMAIPVFNDIDQKKDVRLNNAMVIQDVRLPERMFISLAGGVFQRNRAGFHAKWRKYILNYRLSFGMDMSWTVFTDLTGPITTFPNERKALTSLVFRADYLWAKHNVVFELHAGHLYRNIGGVTGRVFRQFGEVRLGAFMSRTELGSDGGFFFRLPLVPRKYMRPGPVRLTGEPFFETNYSYERFGSQDDFYQMAPTLIDGLWEYFPSTVEQYFRN